MDWLTPSLETRLPPTAAAFAEQLLSQGVCSVCVPRIIGVRKAGLFARLSQQRRCAGACPACLDLLAAPSLCAAVENAVARLRGEVWRGAKTFCVSVRIPISRAIHARPDAAALLDRNPVLIDSIDGMEFRIMPNQIDVKEVLKQLLVERLESALPNLKFDPKSDLLLEIGYDHPETDSEYEFMTEIEKCGLTVRKSRKVGNTHIEGARWDHLIKAAKLLTREEFIENGYLPLRELQSPCVMREFRFLHSSIWLAGRYNKYQRTISNSRMEVNGIRLAPESVQELIGAHVDAFFHSDTHRFSSSGREDVDVLMLGTGRPFFFEVVNPRILDATKQEIIELEKKVNESCAGKVHIRYLQIVSKSDTRHLKDSAATKKKSYTTLIKLSSPVSLLQLQQVSDIKELQLKQQTPVRVQNSRSDLMRDKVIHEMTFRPEVVEAGVDKFDLIRMDLVTSAGTYVKEFVHGDGGRTAPSVKELLLVDSAIVVALDVLHVDLDWPLATCVQ
ncbi:hypothetical protein BDR26DRAFT_843438 [Obelidium mucronatum]|nr:hypothetical protein BDR26DRAFT_843438 [Obelidium mucronatum]